MSAPQGFDIAGIARELKQAQDSAQHIEPITDRYQDFDLKAAYRVGHQIHLEKIAEGARPVGRKIGFTNPDMWSRYGVNDPIWAYIYDTTTVRTCGAQEICSLGKFVEPKIEPEIVFHIRETLPVKARIEDLANCIDWVAHGFEIVQSHYPGWQFQAADTVADCALHGALFVGPPRPLSSLGSDVVGILESFSLSLFCDDHPVESARGANVLGNPLAAVSHLVSLLEKQADHAPVKAGEILTTGTITTAQAVCPGEIWRSEIKDLPIAGLEIVFTP